MKNKINNLIDIIKTNFKHVITAFFFIGFIIDSIYLPDYLSPWSRYLGAIYIFVATLAVIAKNNTKIISPLYSLSQSKYKDTVSMIIDLIIAYAIGSTLSFVFIYYYRSVQVVAMWPILIGLIALMCINEFVKSAIKRSLIEISLLIFCIYLYLIYVFPFLFYALSSYILWVSIIFALLINMAIARILLYDRQVEKNLNTKSKIEYLTFKSDTEINNFGYKLLIVNIFIPLFILILYMTNNLPAVPITLKNIQVYNDVKRDVVKNNSNYTYSIYNKDCERNSNLIIDKNDYATRLKELFFSKKIYVNCKDTSSRVAAYTAVYMPGFFYKNNLISHVWMHYSTSSRSWTEIKRRDFAIVGGRDNGYRGFTYIDNPMIGDWKLRVINNDGRLIGEYKFEIK